VVEEAIFEQIDDLQAAFHIRAVSEALLQNSGVLDQMIVLAFMSGRAGVSGFSKELFFMGKVNADMFYQAFHYRIEGLPGMTVDHRVVQFAEQNQ
jgi:hypothetical protein